MNGWYPDPGGVPGRYRYWDGQQWSTELGDDPRSAPPGPATPGGRPPRRRLGLIIGVLSAVVLLVIIGAVVVGNLRGAVPVVDPAPTGTVSGGNDASPTATPTPTPTAPVRTPTATTPNDPSLVSCRPGDPDERAVHPSDDRVYGGNLSFLAQPLFDPATVEPRLSFAYDVVQQTLVVSDRPAWIAQLAVGRLRAADGFDADPETTVTQALDCIFSSNMYQPYRPVRHDVRSSSVVIDRRPGWLLESEIRVDQPGLAFAGDRVVVVVVRDRSNWGMFFGAAPIDDLQLNAVLDQAVTSLRVS